MMAPAAGGATADIEEPRQEESEPAGFVAQTLDSANADESVLAVIEAGEAPVVSETGSTSVVTQSDLYLEIAPVLERRPESRGEQLFRRAREEELAGEPGAAAASYRELLLEEPDNVRARNNLGCLFNRQGQHGLALEQFEAARLVAPDNIEVLLNLGDALGALGRYDQAERELRRAQKLDASRPDVHLHLGVLLFKRGLYAQADVELRKAIDLDPSSATASFYRGEALNHLGRADDALEALLRSVALQPRNPRAYYLMGILYDKKRMPEQAMAMYKRSREVGAA